MRIPGFVLAATLAPSVALYGQTAPQNPCGTRPDSSVEVAAGPEYAAGPLKRWLFGSDYRRAWLTPIRVPVLDLATCAGGLTPLSLPSTKPILSTRLEVWATSEAASPKPSPLSA